MHQDTNSRRSRTGPWSSACFQHLRKACFSARSKTNFCCVRRNSHEQSPGVQSPGVRSVLTHVPSVASHHHRLLPCSKFINPPSAGAPLSSQCGTAPTESTCSFLFTSSRHLPPCLPWNIYLSLLSCQPDILTRGTILAFERLCLEITRGPALNHHDPLCHFQFKISPSVSDDDDLLVVISPIHFFQGLNPSTQIVNPQVSFSQSRSSRVTLFVLLLSFSLSPSLSFSLLRSPSLSFSCCRRSVSWYFSCCCRCLSSSWCSSSCRRLLPSSCCSSCCCSLISRRFPSFSCRSAVSPSASTSSLRPTCPPMSHSSSPLFAPQRYPHPLSALPDSSQRSVPVGLP